MNGPPGWFVLAHITLPEGLLFFCSCLIMKSGVNPVDHAGTPVYCLKRSEDGYTIISSGRDADKHWVCNLDVERPSSFLQNLQDLKRPANRS